MRDTASNGKGLAAIRRNTNKFDHKAICTMPNSFLRLSFAIFVNAHICSACRCTRYVESNIIS
jgi:hypothetical protein